VVNGGLITIRRIILKQIFDHVFWMHLFRVGIRGGALLVWYWTSMLRKWCGVSFVTEKVLHSQDMQLG